MHTFWRLLRFLHPYRRAVTVSAVLAGLAMGATVLIPFLLGRAVDAIRHGQRHTLAMLAIGIGGAGLARLVLTVSRRMVAGRVSLGVEYDLRSRLYGHLQSLELGFFDRQQTGQLMSRVTVDLQAVRFFLGYGLIFIMQSALTILFTAGAMLELSPGLAALALIPVPVVVLVAQRYGRRARPAIQEVQQRIAELTADAEESISGVRVIKAFAREDHQRERFGRSVGRVFEQAMISTRLQAFFSPLIGFLPQLGLAAILFFGGRRVVRHSLTLGEFTAFYTYLLMLLSPMRTLGMALGMSQRAVASGARIFQLLDREPELVSAPGAPPLPAGRGEISLRGVSLRYEGASEPALDGVDLEIAPGSTVALVGATGSGKTSLVAAVARLYDVQEGSVRVDGADVRDVDVRSLRRSIAVVDDDPFLFSASVAENIAYARAGAGREEVERAARRAQAHEFVMRLPEGFETRIGERGLTLSGGQRQRLAIARALLADPRILVLDDATSSLDASTEREVKVALREVMAGRTTLIIAHRLSTIALADEIVVLEHGRVAAHGSHEQLLEVSGLYREIVERGLPDQVFLTRKPLEREVAGL
jgi:ATP-binding cassette subfamily B protein